MSKWKRQCKDKLSFDFIREYKNRVNWEKVCRNTINKTNPFPYAFVREFEDKIRWDILVKVPHEEKFWDEFGKKYKPDEWAHIIEDPKLFSNELLLKYANRYYTWKVISVFRKLDEQFMDKYADHLDWNALSLHQDMSADFIDRHRDKINVHNLLFWKQAGFTQSQLREFVFTGDSDEDKDNQRNASKQKGVFDINFIREQQDKIDFELLVLHNKNFPPEFFYEFGHKLPTDLLEGTQNMPEQFIERNAERWNWFNIYTCQKLSDDFIKKHFDKFKDIRCDVLFSRQQMSEDTILWMVRNLGSERVRDQHAWRIISREQKLSEDFICHWGRKLDWYFIFTHQDISIEFRKKWVIKLNSNERARYKDWLESEIAIKNALR